MEFVEEQMRSGAAEPSFVADLLGSLEGNGSSEDAAMKRSITYAAAILFGAGEETTFGAIVTFILLMVLYPEVQRKAQAEIDQVIGSQRLPIIDDRESLPYVNAVISEAMRWNPLVPTGVARRVAKGDEYQGYHFPPGSTIVPNIWALTRDEDLLDNPEEFRPERFLGQQRPLHPENYVFGFGRRICPGRHLAMNSIFLFISSILATFDISNAHDEQGNEIPLEPKFKTFLVSYPESFPCNIQVRSDSARANIEKALP